MEDMEPLGPGDIRNADPGATIIAAAGRPASDLIFNVADLDCAYIGNRVLLHHPGRDSLNVEAEPITTAIAAGVLKIKTAVDEGSKTGVAPNSATDITSAASSQKQSGLDVTGQGVSWVEVATPQTGLIARIRLTAMKT